LYTKPYNKSKIKAVIEIIRRIEKNQEALELEEYLNILKTSGGISANSILETVICILKRLSPKGEISNPQFCKIKIVSLLIHSDCYLLSR
jgi:hypothetical protein